MDIDIWIDQFDAAVLAILAAREDIPSPANGQADSWYTGGSSHNDYRPSAEVCDVHERCVVVHDEQAWEHVDPDSTSPEAYAAEWLGMILPEQED